MSAVREEAGIIIEEVLNRDEFTPKQYVSFDRIKKILDDIFRVLEKVLDFIGDIINKITKFIAGLLPKSGGGGSGISVDTIRIIVTVLISLVAAALVCILVILIVRMVKRSAKYKAIGGDSFAAELEEYSNDAEAPYGIACELRDKGDCRGSFRYLFISLLVLFGLHGIIEIHKSKTNRRYLAEIKQESAELFAMSQCFFESFNLYWYGGRGIDAEELSEWFKRYDENAAFAAKLEKSIKSAAEDGNRRAAKAVKRK